MRKRSRLFVVSLIVAMVGFAFAATAFAASVQEIKDRGVLKVGVVDFEMEPFVFTKDGQLTGLDIELTAAIAEKLGVKVELVRVPWDGGMTLGWDPNYKWDKYDIAASSITIKDTRAEICDFSEWYVTSGQMAFVLAESGMKTLDDLKGKKIAFLAGSIAEGPIKERYPDSELMPVPTIEDTFKAVAEKKADAGVNDGAPTLLIARKDKSLFVIEEPLTKERYGISMQKGSDLKPIIDEIVKAMRKDLYNKWLK